MADLTDGEKITRLFDNEAKFESFMNSYNSYAASNGEIVESLLTMVQNFKNLYNTIVNRGAWTTGTNYAVNDIFSSSGTWYIVLVQHVSGVFATDLTNKKFEVYQGVTFATLGDSNAASLLGFIQLGANAVTQSIERKLREGAVSPWDFYNGTDMHSAVAACFASSAKKITLAGTDWVITSGITSSVSNRQIWADGGSITANTGSQITALTITGQNTQVSININGNDKIAVGVRFDARGGKLKNSIITNIKGVTGFAAGVYFNNVPGSVKQCDITNVIGTSNGIFGDGIGSARAVLFFTDHDIEDGKCIVKDCYFDYVEGDDGDIVHFQGNSASGFYYKMNGLLDNCFMKNADRRFVKAQCSEVTISNNIIKQVAGVLSGNGNDVGCINAFLGNNIKIINNNIETVSAFNGIQVTGDAARVLDNIEIFKNNVKADNNVTAIYVEYINTGEIEKNNINGGSNGIGAGYCKPGFKICNNNINGGATSTGYDITLTSTNDGIHVFGNTSNDNGNRLYMLFNNCPNAKVYGNTNYGSTSAMIRPTASAAGSMYWDNTNYSSSPTYAIPSLTDIANQIIFNGNNLGTGGTGGYGGKTVFVKGNP